MKLTIVTLLILQVINLSTCTRQEPVEAVSTPQTQYINSMTQTPITFIPKSTPLSSEIKFVSKTVNEQAPDYYKIEAEYPQVESPSVKHFKSFNRWIEKFVLDDVSEFRTLEKADEKGQGPVSLN